MGSGTIAGAFGGVLAWVQGGEPLPAVDTDAEVTILIIYASLTLGLSFLCSLLEASLFSVSIATLKERSASGRGVRWLLDLKSHRLDDAISAILTLNTISNTLGATLAGAQMRKIANDMWVGVFSGVLTFLILTFSEIIPKTVGATYARGLAGFVGYALRILTVAMTPVLFFTRALTRLLTRGKTSGISRGELEAIIDMAVTTGELHGHESLLYRNILRFDKVQIGDVMTPRTVCYTLPQTTTVEEFLAEPDAAVYSRIPIYGEDRDDVTGYIYQRDILRAAALGADRLAPISDYLREIGYLPEVASLRKALDELAQGRESIVMVADEHGGTCGLVTLEDVLETILGVEIVDEVDEIADLRQRAKQIRERRLARLRERRQLRSGAEHGDHAEHGEHAEHSEQTEAGNPAEDGAADADSPKS